MGRSFFKKVKIQLAKKPIRIKKIDKIWWLYITCLKKITPKIIVMIIFTFLVSDCRLFAEKTGIIAAEEGQKVEWNEIKKSDNKNRYFYSIITKNRNVNWNKRKFIHYNFSRE